MPLRSRIQSYLEARNQTLRVARRVAEVSENPYVVRVYLDRDLDLHHPPGGAERRDVIRHFRVAGWSDVFFDDPSANQLTDTILVLVAEPLGWPREQARRRLRGHRP